MSPALQTTHNIIFRFTNEQGRTYHPEFTNSTLTRPTNWAEHYFSNLPFAGLTYTPRETTPYTRAIQAAKVVSYAYLYNLPDQSAYQ